MCKDSVTGFMFGLSAGLFIGYFLKHYDDDVPQAVSLPNSEVLASKEHAAALSATASGTTAAFR